MDGTLDAEPISVFQKFTDENEEQMKISWLGSIWYESLLEWVLEQTSVWHLRVSRWYEFLLIGVLKLTLVQISMV